MSMRYFMIYMALSFAAVACNKSDLGKTSEGTFLVQKNGELMIDKARYAPGESVAFTFTGDVSGTLKIRYRQLNSVIGEASVGTDKWTWNPPAEDYKGYLAELVETVDGGESIVATIGVDVSSSWAKFPRYGFLSKFPKLSDAEMDAVMHNLNRHHLNGIQFYDWHYKHHSPLAGTATAPAESWKDIINRENFRSTVEGYITRAHDRNMNAMFYNLVYGALNTAAADGVSEKWYMYTSTARTDVDKYVLPKPPFASDILFIDPSNSEWQQYINDQNEKVYAAYAFDGYHMDQVGNRDKTLYRYSGEVIDLPNTFKPFIESVRERTPGKALVMNAVNQYGQEGIANAPVDFLYTEVWSPNETYNALAQVIRDNNRMSGHLKNTVLAAYVNYDLAANPGHFNTASVLLTDAVIFAFGGAHLELGEHMLGKEYFPNSNLEVHADLTSKLVTYYDFLVAYQNLLREGGTFNTVDVKSADGKVTVTGWPMQQGNVAAVGKAFADKQVIHLLNFTKATTDQWRDNAGIQAAPGFIDNLEFTVTSGKPVRNVWFASPDVMKGAPMSLDFSQQGDQVTFTLPGLEYWSMIVMEF